MRICAAALQSCIDSARARRLLRFDVDHAAKVRAEDIFDSTIQSTNQTQLLGPCIPH